MKKLLIILLIFASCKKEDQPAVAPTTFYDYFPAPAVARVEQRPTVPQKPFRSPHAQREAVLYLDFDGYQFDYTRWLSPSGLTEAEQKEVYDTVVVKFAQWKKLAVTTNEDDYLSANPYKRQRVVITETWEPFGAPYGGISTLSSFTSGTPVAAYVFSSNMYWNTGYIGRAIAHETGHTFGLYHQTDTHTDTACHLDRVYGRNKLMGWSYDAGAEWVIGHPHYGFQDPCAYWQDDEQTITEKIKK